MALTKVSTGLLSTELSSVDLSIDAGTLYIDSTQNFVGISNTNPTTQLDVTGNLKVSGTSQVGALTFTSLTNTTNDITEGANNKYFTESRVLDIIPAGSLAGTLGNVKMQYRPDGNYDDAAGSAVAGSFYFDALNSRLKVHTGSEFIDAIPFTAGGGGGGSTADANATFVNYQYTITGSPTNTISGADTQELPAGSYIIGKTYEIETSGTTDFTTFGSADNVSGTQFVATGSGLVTAGDFIIGDEYTIVYEGDSGTETNFVLVGATDSNPGTTFTATNNGSGTGTATQGSGTAHAVLGYSTSASADVVVYVNGIKQRKSSVDGYQATSGTSIGFTYNLPVDSIVDIQVYELLTNDAYYTKLETYTQAETNIQISTALSLYDDQTASDTRYVNTDGDTMAGNLSFPDNDRVIFGANSDLQIYHTPTGNHSIIAESGDGNLILAADHLEINNAANNANKIVATTGGAVTLFHNNVAKLATTSTGIDVTGTVTVGDGHTIGDDNFDNLLIQSSSGEGIRLIDNHATNSLSVESNVGFVSRTLLGTNRFFVDNSTGDISFYEDTGTDPKLFWDASAESLGIGTSSPVMPLDVMANTGANALSLRTRVGDDFSFLIFRSNDGVEDLGGLAINRTAASTSNLLFYTNNNGSATERMRIDSTGNVSLSDDNELFFNASSSSQETRLGWKYDGTLQSWIERVHSDGSLVFGNQGLKRMVIDASGNVGIGTTNPTGFAGYTSLDINNATSGALIDLSQGDAMKGRLIATSSTMAIETASGVPIIFQPAGTERMRIDSSGGIRAATGSRFLAASTGEATPDYSFTSDGSMGMYRVPGSLCFSTGGTERMRIDASGNLGIGVTPNNWSGGIQAIEAGRNGNSYFFNTGNTQVGVGSNIYYETGWKYASASTAAARYEQFLGGHYWLNASGGTQGEVISWTSSMTLDSSGNLLVGTTDSTPYDNSGAGNGGAGIQSDGLISAARQDFPPAIFNRLVSDGRIVEFRKDGTNLVGSIGSRSGVVSYIVLDPRTGVKGAALVGGSVDANEGIINPGKNDGDIADAAISFGTATSRFKDLYLSGGIILNTGGLPSASTNKLDSYEEGTWTPVYDSVSGLTNVTGLSDIDARYTKVGNTVQAHFTYKLTNTGSETISAGDYFIITSASLPFAPHTYVTSGSIDQFIGDHVWYQSIGTNNIASGSVLWGTGGAYLHFGVVNGTPDTGTSAYGLVRLQYDIS